MVYEGVNSDNLKYPVYTCTIRTHEHFTILFLVFNLCYQRLPNRAYAYMIASQRYSHPKKGALMLWKSKWCVDARWCMYLLMH